MENKNQDLEHLREIRMFQQNYNNKIQDQDNILQINLLGNKIQNILWFRKDQILQLLNNNYLDQVSIVLKSKKEMFHHIKWENKKGKI